MRRGEVWWVDFGLPFGSEIKRVGALTGFTLGRLDEGLRQVFGL